MEKPPLENFQEKKDQTTRLEDVISKISGDINNLMRNTFKVDGFVQLDGRIDMQKYCQRGSISKTSFTNDMKYIEEREKYFSESTRPDASPEERMEAWKKKRRETLGSKMEYLAMALFHKFFSQDFLVVRSAAYDDYKNGADMILVNRKTGAVICALDDVVGRADSERALEKNKTITEIIGRDGATLKYGFRVKSENRMPILEEKELNNLPLFSLQVTPEEFDGLYDAIVADPKGTPSRKEQETMERILLEMENQYQDLIRFSPPNPKVRENIKISLQSIKQMQKAV